MKKNPFLPKMFLISKLQNYIFIHHPLTSQIKGKKTNKSKQTSAISQNIDRSVAELNDLQRIKWNVNSEAVRHIHMGLGIHPRACMACPL